MEENIDEYMSQAEQAYEEAVSMLGDMSSWEVYEDSPELAAFVRRSPSGLDILKIEFFIPRQPEPVLDFIYANLCDIHNRLNPDIVAEHLLFRTYSESQRIRYELVDPHILGVNPRELLYFGVKLPVSENVFALIETSVEHPEKKHREGTERVKLVYSLHFCELLEGRCHVVALAYADPKGAIPKSIVNLGMRKRVDFYKVLIREILGNTA
jgi:hypothetical protein